MQDSVATKY